MKNATRIPELDGVRGIAVLIVVVYHSVITGIIPPGEWFRNLADYGVSGVDLFFVLSGFLITGILLDAKGKLAYFRNFYAKRALRIWPLYYLLVLLSFALGPMLIRHAHLPAVPDLALLTSGKKAMYAFLLQNLWYYRVPTFLSVTWSLAIEEQFYIVWPWMVLFFSRKNLARALAVILVLSPCLRLWAMRHGVNGMAIYFETCYRLDGLAFGALIALWCQSDLFSLGRAKWTALAALTVGLPAWIWTNKHHSFPLLFSMMALTSAGAVTWAIWCCRTNSVFGRPLRAKGLQYVGRVSYCLYLVHMPVYYILNVWLVRHDNHIGWDAFLFSLVSGFIVSFIVASLSWYLFESQILKLKGRLEYHPTTASVAPVLTQASQVG